MLTTSSGNKYIPGKCGKDLHRVQDDLLEHHKRVDRGSYEAAKEVEKICVRHVDDTCPWQQDRLFHRSDVCGICKWFAVINYAENVFLCLVDSPAGPFGNYLHPLKMRGSEHLISHYCWPNATH